MNLAKIILAIWNIYEIAYLTGFGALTSFLGSNTVAANAVNVAAIFTPLQTAKILLYGGIIAAITKGCDATVTAQLNQFIVNRGGTQQPPEVLPEKPPAAAPVAAPQPEPAASKP